VALRTLPALLGAGTIVVTGLLVHQLGGRRFAQVIACLCALLAPVYLGVDHYFSMNSIDIFLWALAALLLVRALEGARVADWLALGAVLGLGLLNKVSMLWLGGALALGLLLTPWRRVLLGTGPWLAAALALAIFAPHLIWQACNGWPTLEFMHNATSSKMVHTSLAQFWGQQLLVMGPANVPFWLAGLVWLLASRSWRILGIVYLAVALLLVVSGSSRPNYLSPAYPALLAAGGIALEGFVERGQRAWLRPAAVAWLVLLGLPVVPLALPLLPVESFIQYQKALGFHPRAQEHSAVGPLPQFYADMFGWEELAERVARVYHALPPDERARCGLYCNNYGEAAALDFFGPRYGLPHAISGHNNYWIWGTRGYSGEVMILVGGRRDDPHSNFQSVTLADTTQCEYCMPSENGAPIWVCRGLKNPLEGRWSAVRSYQ